MIRIERLLHSRNLINFHFKWVPPPVIRNLKNEGLTISSQHYLMHCHSSLIILNRRFSSRGSNDDVSIANLQHYKIFAFCLLTSTFFLAWILKQKKPNFLEDCIKLDVDEKLYETQVSLYRYHGFIFPGPIMTSGVFQELTKFQFREEDIIVASFPKAGTTWVQEIVYMLTHDCQTSDASTEVLETRFPYLEYPYPGIRTVSNLQGRRLIKTHLPFSLLPQSFTSSRAKLIYVTRNPRDVAVSYWHFMKLLSTVKFVGTFSDFTKLFTSDQVPYGPFYDHVRGYEEAENEKNVLIISYEDLKENSYRTINDIAEFLQIPVSSNDALQIALSTSFRTMSKNPSVNYEHWEDIGFSRKGFGKFMRKGEVGDWRNYFNSELLATFQAWEKLNGHKLTMNFKYKIPSHNELKYVN